MKIVVIGGTGLIGSKLVEKLREDGHEPLAASPDSGVNTFTGEGLERGARGRTGRRRRVERARLGRRGGARLLPDRDLATSSPRRRPPAWGTTSRCRSSAPTGCTDSGYMRAKLAQEEAVKAAAVPYTILRATQFFEFIGRIADSSTDGDTVRLAPVLVQPEAADDVAAALADVAVSEPVNGIVELAGPEQFRLDELARRVLQREERPAPR